MLGSSTCRPILTGARAALLLLLAAAAPGAVRAADVTASSEAVLRQRPEPLAPVVAIVPARSYLFTHESSGEWLRVTTRDGRTGWVPAVVRGAELVVDERRAVGGSDIPASLRVETDTELRAAPAAGARPVSSVPAGSSVAVQQRLGDWVKVTGQNGLAGWMDVVVSPVSAGGGGARPSFAERTEAPPSRMATAPEPKPATTQDTRPPQPATTREQQEAEEAAARKAEREAAAAARKSERLAEKAAATAAEEQRRAQREADAAASAERRKQEADGRDATSSAEARASEPATPAPAEDAAAERKRQAAEAKAQRAAAEAARKQQEAAEKAQQDAAAASAQAEKASADKVARDAADKAAKEAAAATAKAEKEAAAAAAKAEKDAAEAARREQDAAAKAEKEAAAAAAKADREAAEAARKQQDSASKSEKDSARAAREEEERLRREQAEQARLQAEARGPAAPVDIPPPVAVALQEKAPSERKEDMTSNPLVRQGIPAPAPASAPGAAPAAAGRFDETAQLERSVAALHEDRQEALGLSTGEARASRADSVYVREDAKAVPTTVVSQIVVRVNDEILTNSDFERSVQERLEELKRRGDGSVSAAEEREVRRRLLSLMIEQLVLLEEAKALGLAFDKVYDNAKTRFMKMAGIKDDLELVQILEATGRSWDDFRRDLLRESVPPVVLKNRVYDGITVSEEDIEAHYRLHQEEWAEEGCVRVREIVLQPEPRERTRDFNQRLETLLKSLEAGADFCELARRSSKAPSADDCGMLPQCFTRSQLDEKVALVAFRMKPGDVEPITTDWGFHVIRLEEAKARRTRPLGEVRDQVLDRVRNERGQEEMRRYIDRLRETAKIDVAPEYRALLEGGPVPSAALRPGGGGP